VVLKSRHDLHKKYDHRACIVAKKERQDGNILPNSFPINFRTFARSAPCCFCPLTIGLSVLLLAFVALPASLIPAIRASRLDPMKAVREE
jgi:hypothetical protein